MSGETRRLVATSRLLGTKIEDVISGFDERRPSLPSLIIARRLQHSEIFLAIHLHAKHFDTFLFYNLSEPFGEQVSCGSCSTRTS
jgi:hypothetical protein